VIGAGVVGAATAHALTRAGARVAVLEAAGAGTGTSAASFAVDVSRVKTPRSLFELAVASTREHERLERMAGGDPWRHPAATLEWEDSEDGRRRIRERARRLREWGHPAAWIPADRARALEPAVELPAGDADAVAYFPDGAWYDPPILAQTLLDRAVALGAEVRSQDPVTAVRTAGGRVTGVRTAAGHRIAAGVVVDCAGPNAAEVAALAGVRLPLRRVPGLVVTTAPAHTGLRMIVAAADLNLRPARAGRMVLHSWRVDAELGPGPEWPDRRLLAARLLARARRLVPGLRAAGVESARVGVRPVPPDGLPLVGSFPNLEGFYAVVSHSGVQLAPMLGRLAAAELTGTHQAVLEPFRPARLTTGHVASEALDESTRAMLSQLTDARTEEPARAS